MSSPSYYLPYRKLHSHSKSFYENYLSMLETILLSDKATTLSSATRCLIIGPNSGEYEIELIKKFMPKLQTLTAIEPDAASAAELRKNLQQHLPHVAIDIREEKFQQVYGGGLSANESQFDVITLFQCLNYFTPEDRRALASVVYNNLLKPDGVAIIVHVSRTDDVGSAFEIGVVLGATNPSALLTDREVQSEMESAGFKLVYENEYSFIFDFRDVEQRTADFFSNWLGGLVTVQKLNEAVRKVFPDGVSQDTYKRMMWFQKQL